MPDSLFTFIAQLVNFLIIVIVLRFLLFKRIVSAIENRKSKIAEAHEKARKHEEEAEKRKEELDEEYSNIEAKREELMDSAEKDAEERKKEIINQAKDEAEKQREQWHRRLEKESNALISELKQTAAGGLMSLSKKMFTDLADADVQMKMADKLIQVIENGDSNLVEKLKDSGKITVKSSFPLTAELKETFERELKDVEYTEQKDLHGISLEAGGNRLEWTIESWLDGFGKELRESISGL